jgi:hypothetical protein
MLEQRASTFLKRNQFRRKAIRCSSESTHPRTGGGLNRIIHNSYANTQQLVGR